MLSNKKFLILKQNKPLKYADAETKVIFLIQFGRMALLLIRVNTSLEKQY